MPECICRASTGFKKLDSRLKHTNDMLKSIIISRKMPNRAVYVKSQQNLGLKLLSQVEAADVNLLIEPV